MHENPFSWREFLFSFQGRVSRRQYWLKFMLPIWLPAITISTLIDSILGYEEFRGPGSLILLLVFWPSAAVIIKRWHDRNKVGWWFLIGLIPYIGPFWVLIENGFLPGTAGSNRFGEEP